MTEADWLADPDWVRHVQYAADRIGPRKRRLLAAAFCRAGWHLFDEPTCRTAVEVAERFADGRATAAELEAAQVAARRVAIEAHDAYTRAVDGDSVEPLAHYLRHTVAWAAAYAASPYVEPAAVGQRVTDAAVRARTGEVGLMLSQAAKFRTPVNDLEAAQTLTLRDVVFELLGNPFAPPVVLPGWRTDTVRAVTARVVEHADWATLPVLADALEDAGCDDRPLLDHLRGPGPHARGCWALDAVVG